MSKKIDPEVTNEPSVAEQIELMRDLIDSVDEAIIELVRQRTELATKVARLKRENRIPIIDGIRERIIFKKYAAALGYLGKQLATALLTRRTRDAETSE